MSNAVASSEAKRRKLRKGTTSCWECKRRKIKCEYEDGHEKPPCKPCIERRLECVSQELPEPSPSYLSYANAAAVAGDSKHAELHPSYDLGSRTTYKATRTYRSNGTGVLENLSHTLIEALPSRDDLVSILRASDHPSLLAHELNTTPVGSLSKQRPTTQETLLDTPNIDTHPVLIAKYMLLLASFIQQLHPDFLQEISGLSEKPIAIMRRLVGLANSLVTTNDDILGSIESLECLMIEGLFQMNTGNLRRAWLTIRRALNIAELMKLNRSNPPWRHRTLNCETKCDPRYMWFKIVFLDRYLGLMLGLPQGSNDNSMASDAMLASEKSPGRLERIHCLVASRILERNESYQTIEHANVTHAMDMLLQKAAKDLPSKWWLTPTLDAAQSDSETSFWNTRHLFAQIIHYDLLNQLHLPYMLCSVSPTNNYEYSRITCVNASREMLSRWIVLRNSSRVACSCRSVDFVALMAAMTLLLAHLRGRQLEANLLAHQYQSDRAMIEQVRDRMNYFDQSSSDLLSAKSADLLRRLLAIDGEAADGDVRPMSVEVEGNDTTGDDVSDSRVNVHIPYFGTIKIAGTDISKIRPPVSSSGSVDSSDLTRAGHNETETSSRPSSEFPRCDIAGQRREVMLQTPDTHTSAGDSLQDPELYLPDESTQPDLLPSLAAGMDDWAFQGVDQAFFENLMRGEDISYGDSVDRGFA